MGEHGIKRHHGENPNIQASICTAAGKNRRTGEAAAVSPGDKAVVTSNCQHRRGRLQGAKRKTFNKNDGDSA